MTSDEVRNAGALIDAWRERGDHRFDPIRFRFIEVLARRAAAHGGEVRRVLDEKLTKLIAAYSEDAERARYAGGEAAGQHEKGQARRGPLAELVDRVARNAPSHGEAVPGLLSAPELKTLDYFRSTWARLSADRRLTQSLAKVPKNAGPLNSQHLVHRSLTLMRDVSPEYLHRFMSYVDALSWLDHSNGPVPRRTSGR